MSDDLEKMAAEPAAEQRFIDEVTLWQDHANREGYRAQLRLLTSDDGRKCFELSSGGRVVLLPYTFPFLERDRL